MPHPQLLKTHDLEASTCVEDGSRPMRLGWMVYINCLSVSIVYCVSSFGLVLRHTHDWHIMGDVGQRSTADSVASSCG